jgi:hypothetical protein
MMKQTIVRRDKRYLERSVTIINHEQWSGRSGLVKGFRGDWGQLDGKVVPYVLVFVENQIRPIPGHHLQLVPRNAKVK